MIRFILSMFFGDQGVEPAMGSICSNISPELPGYDEAPGGES